MRAPFELTAERQMRGTRGLWQEHQTPVTHATTPDGGIRPYIADDLLSPEEKLLGAIVWRAAKDLEDQSCPDEYYSTAVDFFRPNEMYKAIAAILDLSDTFLEKCRSKINGRKTIPVQGILL